MIKWKRLLLLVLLLLLSAAAYVWVQLRSLEVEQLSDDLYVLRGLGGNVAVLRTDAGTVVVDSMTLPWQGQRIRETARALTGMDTVLLINTHYHLDHTHGNPAFAADTRVLSTARTLHYLRALDADFWAGDAARLLPNETVSDRRVVQVGNKTLVVLHPGAGHTDGDLVVLFEQERAIHMGDLLFSGHYPNIDLEAGGTVQGWPTTLRAIQQLDFETVIPGHGATTDRAGIVRFQSFLEQLGELARHAARDHTPLQQFLRTQRLTLDENLEDIRMIIPVGLNRKFVLQRAWEETTGNFTRTATAADTGAVICPIAPGVVPAAGTAVGECDPN